MTRQEYEWYVKLHQDRLQHFNLSFEQAEKVYRYEEELSRYSHKSHMTTWEESDYALYTFRQILDPEQFKLYEQFRHEYLRREEQGLMEQDEAAAAALASAEEKLRYLEQDFLPPLFQQPVNPIMMNWSMDKTKRDFLKKEYAAFLNDKEKQIISDHFRNYRGFKPNELRLSLLHHKQAYILPDYFGFKDQADAPTLAVAAFFKTKYRHLSGEYKELLVRKLAEWKAFQEKIFKQQHPNGIAGWHISAPPLSADEEAEYHLMLLLLLDFKKYSTDPVIEEPPAADERFQSH